MQLPGKSLNDPGIYLFSKTYKLLRMKKQSICVFARWQVKEEHLQQVLDMLPQLVEESTNEEGNLFYKVHQSVSDTHTLVLFEGYKDKAALDKHRGSEHFKNLVIKQIVPLLEKRDIVIANEIFTASSIKS
jgi:quinol monooxygenase YgiN